MILGKEMRRGMQMQLVLASLNENVFYYEEKKMYFFKMGIVDGIATTENVQVTQNVKIYTNSVYIHTKKY